MPGRSMISTAREGPISDRPSRVEVVVPGKLEVLARAPQRRLKVVVLPVFGLPIRATRSSCDRSRAATRGTATAATAILSPLGGRRDDVDLSRDGSRQPDASSPHLDDAGIAVLAQA